jgi:hypothetical protein
MDVRGLSNKRLKAKTLSGKMPHGLNGFFVAPLNFAA